tara:strand:+ start:533 stop:1888 length:1356 start_codon:yes stop_codon:yes gene_type:complete
MKDDKIKAIMSLILIIALFIIISFIIQENIEQIKPLLDFGILGMIIYFIIVVIGIVFAPLTTVPLWPLASGLWGWEIAGVLNSLGWIVGAIIAFWIGRKYGEPLVKKLISLDQLRKYEKMLPEEDILLSVIILRMIIPVDILSYGLGIFTKVKYKTHFIGTIIGIPPVAFLVSYIGLIQIKYQILIAIIIIDIILILYLINIKKIPIDKKIKNHIIATKKLNKTKDKAFKLIKENINNISEYEVQQFILEEFKKQNLVRDKVHNQPIVAVNQNSAFPHYTPSKDSKKLKMIKKDSLILIDIWANYKEGYFGDITWIGYSNKKIPKNIQETFSKVIKSRDLALDYIRSELKNKRLPNTNKIDKLIRDYFKKSKVDKFFIHGTGHSLGLKGCHGSDFRINKSTETTIKQDIPFTIEPGLYFKNKFGIRSEIDCYIKDYELIITSSVQKKIILL